MRRGVDAFDRSPEVQALAAKLDPETARTLWHIDYPKILQPFRPPSQTPEWVQRAKYWKINIR